MVLCIAEFLLITEQPVDEFLQILPTDTVNIIAFTSPAALRGLLTVAGWRAVTLAIGAASGAGSGAKLELPHFLGMLVPAGNDTHVHIDVFIELAQLGLGFIFPVNQRCRPAVYNLLEPLFAKQFTPVIFFRPRIHDPHGIEF